MKELFVGLAIGMAAGFAIGVSGCGQDIVQGAKRKLKKACQCAEQELDKMQQNLDQQPFQNNCNGNMNNHTNY